MSSADFQAYISGALINFNGLGLNMFSIKECRILWDKRKRIPKKAKHAIKKDLLGMSDLIHEAMEYTRDKALKGRETEIVYWLNTGVGEDCYTIKIWYEHGTKAWGITIEDHGELIGEIVSDKWRLLQLLLDEDIEPETM